MARQAHALVLSGPRSLEPRVLEIPTVAEDDAVLRIEACGLCGTDHEQYSGHIKAPFAFIPGHEIVGVIEEVGPAAADRWGVVAGDRVAVEVFQSCRTCDACVAGTYRRCRRNGMATMYGFVDVTQPPGLWGGYATHLYLSPDAMLLPVPNQLEPVVATAFNPIGAGIRWAATIPSTGPGDVVAVLGPGIRGLAAAAAAKRAGAAFVMMTGLGPRDTARLTIAPRFGVDLAVDVAQTDPVAALRDATGGLAHVVVDVTAKAPEAFAQAVKLAAPGATVVVAGTRGGTGAPDFNPDHIVFKELTIVGSLGVDYPAYEAAFEMLAGSTYPFAALPREVVGFDGLPGLLARLAGDGDDTDAPPVHSVFVPDVGPAT